MKPVCPGTLYQNYLDPTRNPDLTLEEDIADTPMSQNDGVTQKPEHSKAGREDKLH